MDKKTLISIRIDERVLLKIEEILRRKTWWKRSGLINQLLYAVLSNASYTTITELLILGNNPSKQFEIIVKEKEEMKL